MFSRISHLTVRQYLWILTGYFRLGWIKLVLKFASPQSILKNIEFNDFPSSTNVSADSLPARERLRSEQIYESVRLAARLHFGHTDCLPRAIVLAKMLGKGSRVKIGVQKKDGGKNQQRPQIVSHAWVEHHGVVVHEPQVLDNFVPLK